MKARRVGTPAKIVRGIPSVTARLVVRRRRGHRAHVVEGDGLRSGHGPVAEFLVGAAALTTARIHRVLSSYRLSQREALPRGEPSRARGSFDERAPVCRGRDGSGLSSVAFSPHYDSTSLR